MIKKCNRCAIQLPANTTYFQRRASSADGLSGTCKICRAKYLHDWRTQRGLVKPRKSAPEGMKYCSKCDSLLEATTEYFHRHKGEKLHSQCKSCMNAQIQNWCTQNRDHRKQQAKERYLRTHEQQSQYYKDNRSTINQKTRARYVTNEQFALTSRLRGRLSRAFKDYSTRGKTRSADEYGINYQAIIDYLGPCPGPRNKWHIDHIQPLASFDFNDAQQVKQAFAPENHQWLKAEENLRKNQKRSTVNNKLKERFNG